MSSALRIVIAADNVLSRAGLAALLASQPDCTVLGQISLDRLIEDQDVEDADVVLVEMGWQIVESLDVLSDFDAPDVPLLVLLNDEADGDALLGVLATFDRYGLLLSETEPEELLLALRTVAAGFVVLDSVFSSMINRPPAIMDAVVQELTPRENDVLQLLAKGLTNKAIAHQLGITDHTVKFHVNAIMTKLGAQSRTEAVILATRAGLIIL